MSINIMSKREKLIYVRQSLNITQKELAKDNLSREFISMVESGKRSIRREMAITAMKNALEYAKERDIDIGLDEEFIARSEEEDLCKLCDELSNTKDNIEKCYEVIEYANEKDIPIAKVHALKKLGDIFFIDGEYENASNKYVDAIRITETIGRRDINHKLYHNLGVVKNNIGDYANAINYEKEALTFCNINNDEKIRSLVFYNLAANYFMLNKFEASKKCLDKLFESKLSKYLYSKGRSLYGYIYIEQNEYDKALDIYNELLKEDLDPHIMIEIYHNTALCHQKKREFDESEKYFDMALDLSKNDLRSFYKLQGAKGYMYFDKGMYKEAIDYLYNSIKLGEKFEDFRHSIEASKVLYNLYDIKKDEKKKKEIALYVLKISNDNNISEDNMWSVEKLLEIALENNDLEFVKEVLEKIKGNVR